MKNLSRSMSDFLIACRDESGFSDTEIANRSSINSIGQVLERRVIARIESNPLKADAIQVAAYMKAIGRTPEEFYQKLNELTDNRYIEEVNMGKADQIHKAIQTAQDKVNAAKQFCEQVQDEVLVEFDLNNDFDALSSQLESCKSKPIIVAAGLFDSAKSTLNNTFIGANVLPEKFQPATSVVNLLCHIDDRPKTIQSSTAVFSKGFLPYMMYNEKLVQKHLIAQGTYDLLKEYGQHDHIKGSKNKHGDAFIAIVFLDVERLKNIWLMDTPGDLNSTDLNDTEKALTGVELADGIFYTSSNTGFLQATDLNYMAQVMRSSPPVDKNNPLAHICFVQTHCHPGIADTVYEEVSSTTFSRIQNSLIDLVINPWKEDVGEFLSPTVKSFADRTVCFWRETKADAALEKLDEMAEFLLVNRDKRVNQRIEIAYKTILSKLENCKGILQKRKETSDERTQEVDSKVARFRKEVTTLESGFRETIDGCRRYQEEDQKIMGDYIERISATTYLHKLLKENFGDKKQAEQNAGDYISQLISVELEKNLKRSGRDIGNKVDELLREWQRITPSQLSTKSTTAFGTSIDGSFEGLSDFDSRAAFIGSMAGLGSFGAMALYVSTIASNLGAYVLVGKVAGVLVSMGIVSSVTTVTSFVAAIGGPITIGIAIAAAIGLLVFRLTSGSWEEALAKKIAKSMSKSGIEAKISEVIQEFWFSTQKAISQGFDGLRAETEEHIERLIKSSKTEYDVSELESAILKLDSIKKLIKADK